MQRPATDSKSIGSVSGQEIIGVHEIPSFISDCVETPGLTPDNPALEPFRWSSR